MELCECWVPLSEDSGALWASLQRPANHPRDDALAPGVELRLQSSTREPNQLPNPFFITRLNRPTNESHGRRGGEGEAGEDRRRPQARKLCDFDPSIAS